MNKIITLKGGSLNSTRLFITDEKSFVRKSISTDSNREYGYVRWYSQLKKLQRFNKLFPGTVPKVLNVGVEDNSAYFDIEYISGTNVKTYLQSNTLTDEDLKIFNNKLWQNFDIIHSHSYHPNSDSLKLYYYEEVQEKLKSALQIEEFKKFYDLEEFSYLGNRVVGFQKFQSAYKKLFDKKINIESCIHGNPTLENIMYDPITKKITFIDLYEESIVDTKFLDYSQVLQCSDSGYGILNDHPKIINGSNIDTTATININFNRFNKLFMESINSRYSEDEIMLIKLFETTQFFRMLPFKCLSGDVEGAKFFYAHACYKVNNLL
jgi:hypothetical protein